MKETIHAGSQGGRVLLIREENDVDLFKAKPLRLIAEAWERDSDWELILYRTFEPDDRELFCSKQPRGGRLSDAFLVNEDELERDYNLPRDWLSVEFPFTYPTIAPVVASTTIRNGRARLRCIQLPD